MFQHRLRRTALAALLGAVLIPGTAQAASQTISDASGDGGTNDVREAGWDVDASNVTFRLAVPYSTWTGGYNNRALAFLDTNADGRSDYAVQAFSGANTSMTLYRTPQSTAACQKAGTGAE